MEYKDYYKIMGLTRDASQDEIKRSYRKLARKFHPDISKEPNAEARFKEIAEAYEVLKDPVKRKSYDRIDPNMRSGQSFQPPPDWGYASEFTASGFGETGFSDFFELLFGRQRTRQSRGQDQHAKLFIDLESTFYGATQSFTLQTMERSAQGLPQRVDRTLHVKIPPGIKEGQQLRLKNQGSGNAGQESRGDLYLEIHFNAHPFYRPEGRDLHMQLPVTPWEAALGAMVRVPTPKGIINVKIPPDSNSGSKLRLKGRGIPGNPAGDIYLTLTVMAPPADNEQVRALYQQISEAQPYNPRAGLGV